MIEISQRPASPLDGISPKLYNHIPRFSTALSASTLDFSDPTLLYEDSLSSDDEEIVREPTLVNGRGFGSTLKRAKEAIHNAAGSLWNMIKKTTKADAGEAEAQDRAAQLTPQQCAAAAAKRPRHRRHQPRLSAVPELEEEE